MFRELRLKLTLINVVVMALLLLLFVIGTFLIMKAELFNQSQQLMQVIASEAGSDSISDMRKHDRPLAKYFYLKTNASGKIQQTLDRREFPLHTVLQEVIESFRFLAESNGILLECSLSSEVSYFGDASRIKQLVVILLDNAIKYTPPGGQVTLALQNYGTTTEITVSDNGEGIEQEYLAKIFERFYRVDKARSQQKEGTGLGLAIANWIVKSHHGRIKVSSSPGEGTSFIISFPRHNW